MKFTFTNVSEQVTAQDAKTKLSPLAAKQASPTLRLTPDALLDLYYDDNAPHASSLDGMTVQIPLYNSRFVTLYPSQSISISASSGEEIAFYNAVVNNFESENYEYVQCEVDPEPEPPTGYTIPLELQASSFVDSSLGLVVIIGDSRITNLKSDGDYDMTLYDAYGNNYKVTTTATSDDGMIDVTFNFPVADFPEDIKAIYDTMNLATFTLLDGYTELGPGDGFILMPNFPEGVTADIAKTMFNRFVISEAAPPEIIDLPFSLNSSDLFEFMGAEHIGAYEEYHKRLNVSVGTTYKMTLTTSNDSYEATAVAQSVSDPDMGITYTDLSFTFSDSYISDIVGALVVDNGAYLNLDTGEPSTDGYILQITMSGNYTLADFKSVVNTLILSEN